MSWSELLNKAWFLNRMLSILMFEPKFRNETLVFGQNIPNETWFFQ
jgi:hypothetical protein